jgi:hypothetical protein
MGEREELIPYNVGDLVEISMPAGELRRWDGDVGIIMTRRKLIEKFEEFPPRKVSDQESFRNLNCWEYEIMVRGKVRWFTHYALLKYEGDYVS